LDSGKIVEEEKERSALRGIGKEAADRGHCLLRRGGAGGRAVRRAVRRARRHSWREKIREARIDGGGDRKVEVMGLEEGKEEERTEPVLEKVLRFHELRRKIEPNREHFGFVGGMPEESSLPDARLPGEEDEARFSFYSAVELAGYELQLGLAARKESRRMGTRTGMTGTSQGGHHFAASLSAPGPERYIGRRLLYNAAGGLGEQR
jgi:hypothetical protein